MKVFYALLARELRAFGRVGKIVKTEVVCIPSLSHPCSGKGEAERETIKISALIAHLPAMGVRESCEAEIWVCE